MPRPRKDDDETLVRAPAVFLTETELADLRQRAAKNGVSVGAAIRQELFRDEVTPKPQQGNALAAVILELAEQITERASSLNRAPAGWLRDYMDNVLKRPIVKEAAVRTQGERQAGDDAKVAAILEESQRRQARWVANGGAPWPAALYGATSKWASMTVAPKQRVTWKPGEPPPPCWLTSHMTKPGDTKPQVIDRLIEEIEVHVGAQIKRDLKRQAATSKS